MSKGIIRFLPPLLFVITGVMAVVQERDYWEAASWFSFAVGVLIFALNPASDGRNRNLKYVAYAFMALGIILLILRVTGVLPEPVRPLP